MELVNSFLGFVPVFSRGGVEAVRCAQGFLTRTPGRVAGAAASFPQSGGEEAGGSQHSSSVPCECPVLNREHIGHRTDLHFFGHIA